MTIDNQKNIVLYGKASTILEFLDNPKYNSLKIVAVWPNELTEEASLRMKW